MMDEYKLTNNDKRALHIIYKTEYVYNQGITSQSKKFNKLRKRLAGINGNSYDILIELLFGLMEKGLINNEKNETGGIYTLSNDGKCFVENEIMNKRNKFVLFLSKAIKPLTLIRFS